MSEESEPPGTDGILSPTVPWDIAVRTQRERVLQAMATNCAEKTYAKTTIADIVAGAGISRATFYKHFADKKECFQAAAEDFLDKLLEAVAESSIRAEGASTSRIRGATATLLERLAAEPAKATLLLIEAPNVDVDIVLRYRRLAMDGLETELRASGQATGTVADPELSFGRAKVLLTSYIAAGDTERLPLLLPELLYIALLPYVGQELALEQAAAR